MNTLKKLHECLSKDSSFFNTLHYKISKMEYKIYYHPIESSEFHEIKKKLRIKHDSETSAGFLKENFPSEMKCLEEFRDLLHNDGMNPHKEYSPSNFFVKDENNKIAYEKILNYLNNLKDSNKPLIQRGRRGIGKTLLQNILIHNNHYSLEKEKIIWIRCDVQKLYEMWGESNSYNFTIQIYHQLQLLYVFCKYYDYIYNKKKDKKIRSELFNSLFNKLKESDYNTLEDNLINIKESGKHIKLTLVEALEKFRKFILTDEGGGYNSSKSYMLNNLISNFLLKVGSDEAVDRWLTVSRKLLRFLENNGCFILYLVDGIDNLNFTGSAILLDDYNRILKNISFLLFQKPDSNFIRYYFCMRVDTFNDLHAYIVCTTNNGNRYFNEDDFVIINQKRPVSLNKIFEKRIEIYLNNSKHTGTTRVNELFKSLLSITEGSSDSEKKYTDIMNIRDYLYNKLGLVRLILLRSIQRGESRVESIKNEYDKYFNKNLFLNGRLYMNSNNSDFLNPNEGRFYFNIFFNKIKSHHLMVLRILQLLSYQKMFRNILVEFCNLSFNYDKTVIYEYLRIMQGFELVEIEINGQREKEDSENKKFFKEAKYSIDELCEYSITEKGNLLFKLIFSDIEILYTLALDTFLPKWFFPLYGDSYYTKENSRTYYIPNCIKTSISFINFLKSINKIEIFNLNKILHDKESKLNKLDVLNEFITEIRDNEYYLVDKIFSLENYINYESLSKQIELFYHKIKLNEEREILINFTNI